MRHLLTLADLTTAEIERIFSITEDLKNKCEQGLREPLLPGRVMALLFEKPSLRTRVSFEAGMAHLGGSSMFLGNEAGFGRRESIADFARVLGEYADVVVVRANRHQTVVEIARALHLLGHQRPDRLRPPLPGAGRSVHAPRAGRQAGGPYAGLDRRRQQRGPQPGRRLRQAGHAPGHGHAPEAPVRREIARLDQAASARPGSRRHHRSGRGGARRRGRLHRRLGEHGPGKREGGPPAGVRPLPGQRQADGARPRRARSSCTACPPIAARKSPTR